MTFFVFDSFSSWAPQNQKLCWEHRGQVLSTPLFELYLRQIRINFDNLHQSDTVGTMKLKTTCEIEKVFSLEVFLESRNDQVEVEVTIGFEWQSTGIGAYEYWGRTGYDAGIKYLEPFETIWDSAGFTPEEIKEIEKEIFASYDKWSKEAEEDCANDHFWLIKNPPSGGFHSF